MASFFSYLFQRTASTLLHSPNAIRITPNTTMALLAQVRKLSRAPSTLSKRQLSTTPSHHHHHHHQQQQQSHQAYNANLQQTQHRFVTPHSTTFSQSSRKHSTTTSTTTTTTSLATTPPPPPTPTNLPLDHKGNSSLYSRIDNQLVTATSTSTAWVKHRLPRGKIIFALVATIGLYLFFQNRIMRNATRYVNQNVINMKRGQAISLQSIASLSREDIFHVFQTIYPDLTSNGFYPIDRISHAMYDEIDDCRDDRKLEQQKLMALVTVFIHDSNIHFATLDKEGYEVELNQLKNEIISNLPENKTIRFDSHNWSLSIESLPPPPPPSSSSSSGTTATLPSSSSPLPLALSGQDGEVIIPQEQQEPVQHIEEGELKLTIVDDHITDNNNNINNNNNNNIISSHHQHPTQQPSHPNPEVAFVLDGALEHTNAIKSQLQNQMKALAEHHQGLIGRLDLSPEQRQVEIGQAQTQLLSLQAQLSALEDQQHGIRAHIFAQFTPTQLNPPPTILETLQGRYKEILTLHNAAVATITSHTKSREAQLATLPPHQQAEAENYLKIRQHAERNQQQQQQHTPSLTNLNSFEPLTPIELDPKTMPTLEGQFSFNYFTPDSDEYKISTWTMSQLFRNMPTGVAGDDRYTKYHEAVVATSLITKTQWSPLDSHYKYYIPPQILRDYRLNVERGFKDYLNDPLCTGGIISFDKITPTITTTTTTTNNNTTTTMITTPPPSELDLFDSISYHFGKFFTMPKSISNIYTSQVTMEKEAEEEHTVRLYTQLHYDKQNAITTNTTTTTPKTIKFETIYQLPVEKRLDALGEIFQRHHPDCQWDKLPIEFKMKIAHRFEHLRVRKLSGTPSKYDYNPIQPLSLAWASMFPPDPLPDTPQAHNQYRRGLGNYEDQLRRVQSTLTTVDQQPLTRIQFERLLKTMCNAGHFKTRTALLSRTNNIFPIAYHITSPKVIAQAYYDVLGKESDDPITLDEFHQAASHWGKVGRFNLWYYSPDLQGEGNKTSSFDNFKLKWGERLCRFLYSYTGIPSVLSKVLTNNPKGTLSLGYLELQNRFATTSLTDPHRQLITDLHNQHKSDLTLAQFSAHSRNVNSSIVSGVTDRKTNDNNNNNNNPTRDNNNITNNNDLTTTELITATTTNTTTTMETTSTINTTSDLTDDIPNTTTETSQQPKEIEKKKKRSKKDSKKEITTTTTTSPSTSIIIDTQQTPNDAV